MSSEIYIYLAILVTFVGLLSDHLQLGRWFQPIAPKFWIKNEILFETTT